MKRWEGLEKYLINGEELGLYIFLRGWRLTFLETITWFNEKD